MTSAAIEEENTAARDALALHYRMPYSPDDDTPMHVAHKPRLDEEDK